MQTSRVTSVRGLAQWNNRMETDNMQSTNNQNPRPGGEKIPPGGWRGAETPQPGGEKIPPGGWRESSAPQPGGEKIPPGGWRATQDEYRTRDGRAFFVFRFVAVGSFFEVDIVSMPSYGGRNEGAHETHRLSSNRGGKRICFGEPSAINTLQIAYEFAESWAENTWKYIKTGERF